MIHALPHVFPHIQPSPLKDCHQTMALDTSASPSILIVN